VKRIGGTVAALDACLPPSRVQETCCPHALCVPFRSLTIYKDMSTLDGDIAEAVRCQIDHALGGDCPDPAQQHATVPDCEGVSVATCEDRIRAAGFTGDIEHETLSAEDADPDNAADKVTGLDPSSGKEIELPDTITIVKNPSTMPTWTPTEDEIADGLEQANPTAIDSTNKKRLARQCAKWADKAGSGTSSADCLLRPVFFTGRDAAEVAEHDISVLQTKPQLVVLNKRTTTGQRSNGCTGTRPTMAQCDEYPFWSTMQWATYAPDISYTYVNRGQNALQGRALGVFYNVTPRFGFPQGCDIQPDDPDDWFLHIPLPKGIPVKTTWACNRAVTP
jgi:hypothetical protein